MNSRQRRKFVRAVTFDAGLGLAGMWAVTAIGPNGDHVVRIGPWADTEDGAWRRFHAETIPRLRREAQENFCGLDLFEEAVLKRFDAERGATDCTTLAGGRNGKE